MYTDIDQCVIFYILSVTYFAYTGYANHDQRVLHDNITVILP